MKAIVVQKEFNGYEVGKIIGLSPELPVNHLSSEGFITAINIPSEFDQFSIKATYVLVAEKWTKPDHVDMDVQPMVEVNQPIITNDESWAHVLALPARPACWTKPGYATQFDPPPMIIDGNGNEIEDTSWTFNEPSDGNPEKWVKNGEEVFVQPTISTENLVLVPDTSWVHEPQQYVWTVVEDSETKSAALEEKKKQKYLKRIQYADVIIAEVARRNESKSLTVPQIIDMNSTYAPIMQMLKSASYTSARSIISAAVPSAGITQEDIAYVVGLIDEHLSGEG